MSILREKFERYGKHWASISLIGGFAVDFFTLWRIDLWKEDLIFILYLAVAAVVIAYLTFRENIWFLLALQFVFGGLFGRFFIFYSRSGSLAHSWPFLLFLAVLFAANERLKKRYLVFAYRMSVFFIALFSFSIFFLPIVVGDMSPTIFVASGFLSLVIIAGLVYGLLAFLPRLREHVKILIWSVAAIYVAINVMYFVNVIPPIPLSLEQAGVFHDVHRVNNQYVGLHEPQPWYKFFQRYEPIHVAEGEPIYTFSAVFAPTKINATIVHQWQYDDPNTGWTTVSSIPFDITGGRDGGYRGYTLKLHTKPGHWRVNIQTTRGQLIGRVKFEIIPAAMAPAVETVNL